MAGKARRAARAAAPNLRHFVLCAAMLSSLDIAAATAFRPIADVADDLGLDAAFVDPYGRYKAKLRLDALAGLQDRSPGRYVLVTAITPTPFGEGKTTTTIGLGMALRRIGRRAAITLRQSSLGPVFGIKGGGAGGGRAQVGPLEESILHVTGDVHAVALAHNLVAALTDSALFHGVPEGLDLDPDRIQIRRVVDVNDRALRHVTVGQGGPLHGIERETGFDIAVASELMAILALVSGDSDAEALHALRQRIGRVVVGFSRDGRPITAEDVKAAGAATVVMRETLRPTLMQTLEGTPALLHAGPFANIATGTSSVLADRLALRLAGYVLTEAGFGMDVGGEKFFHLKCRASGLWPDAAVLVATVRALKAHTGRYDVAPGRGLPPALLEENPDDVREGATNLRHHVETLRRFGVPVVVALNGFPEDHPSEIEAVRAEAEAAGAAGMAVSTAFADGGAGAETLARVLVDVVEQAGAPAPRMLYALDAPLRAKIETIAREVYCADGVAYAPEAAEALDRFEALGFGALPICMAKTPLSLSHDPARKGVPNGFVLPVREARLSAGAGFVYPIAGTLTTMPGLGAHPAAHRIDIDAEGRTVGLF